MANKKDYTNGDQSFKNWFKIMWKNKYILLFLVALTGFVFELIYFKDVIAMVTDAANADGVGFGILAGFGLSLPALMMIVIGYKGFYQFWNDLKNGTSR